MARLICRWGLCAVLTALGVLGGVLLLKPAPVQGQVFPFLMRQPKAGSLLQNGRDAYARGDYDKASQFYQQAQAAARELTPEEQSDLLHQIQQNNLALQERRNGLAQLKQAEEYLQKGKQEEAAQLLRGLDTNQYLAANDRRTLTRLTEQLRKGAPAAEEGKRDAHLLLSDARTALQRGDLDLAERLVAQAEKHQTSVMPSWLRWGDTPATVRRDIQTARARLEEAGHEAAEPSKKETSGFRGIFGWMKPASKEPPAQPGEKKDSLTPAPVGGNTPLAGPPVPAGPETTVIASTQPAISNEPKAPATPPASSPKTLDNTAKAKLLLAEAEAAIKKGDRAHARELVGLAMELQPDLQWWDRKPEDILKTAREPEAGVRPPVEPKVTRTSSNKTPAPAGGKEDSTEQARRLVKEGYEALKGGDATRARLLAEQARSLKPALKFWEDNPERLLADIDRDAPSTAATAPPRAPISPAPPAPTENTDPRALVRQARDLLEHGKLDEADRLAARAAGVTNVNWRLFEDTPAKVRTAISQARQRRERDEAQQMLVEARKLFNQGQLKEAKELAWKARQKYGSPTLMDLGDRPDRLLNEITAAETAQKLNQQNGTQPPAQEVATRPALKTSPSADPLVPPPPPPGSPVAQVRPPNPPANPLIPGRPPSAPGNPLAPGLPTNPLAQLKPPPQVLTPPLPPAPPPAPGLGEFAPRQVQPPPAPTDPRPALVKQKVLALIAEANALLKQDKLIEARTRALEADELVRDSRKQGILVELTDGPDLLLFQLAATTQQRIQQLLRKAEEAVARSSDPGRFDRANAELTQARQLAAAYRLDQGQVTDKAAWLQQQKTGVAQGPNAPPPGVPVPPSVKAPPVPPGAVADLKGQGKQLLEDARREIRRNQLVAARKMIEEAYQSRYGVQEEAAALLRTLDIEEAEQGKLVANRNADAVRDAYIRGHYQQAANIARSIDVRLLTAQKRNNLKEVMGMPEMEKVLAQAAPQQVGPSVGKGVDVPGKASVDTTGPIALGPKVVTPPSPAPAQGSPGFADHLKALEEVQFSKLRQESLHIQREANKVFSADPERALEMLQNCQRLLAEANIDPHKVELLRRPIEKRIQDFKMLKAEGDFRKEQQAAASSLTAGTRREKIREVNEKKKQKEVAELMNQFRALFQEGKYKQAEMYALQARDLDPENVAVGAALQMAAFRKRMDDSRQMKEEKEDYFLKALDSPPGPYVDSKNPIAFDKGNREQLRKRGSAANGISFSRLNAKEKEIEHKLQYQKVNLNLRDTPLESALEDLQSISGVTIFPDKKAMDEAGISLKQPITGKLEDLTLKSALNLLLGQAKLTYIVRNEVVEVTTEDRTRGKLVQVTYPVGDLVVPPQDSPANPVHDLTRTIERLQNSTINPTRAAMPYLDRQAMQGGVAVSTLGSGAGNQGFASNNPVPTDGTSISKMPAKQTIEDQLIKLIMTTVNPDSWAEVGGKGSIQYYPLGLGLVVNQTLDVQEQVADLLRALRKLQDLEVAIEIRLIAVSEAFFERIGMDFDVNFTTGNSRFTPQLLASNFQPFGFPNAFLPDRFVAGLTPAGTFTPDLNVPLRGSSFDFTIPPFGGYPGTLGADGGLSLGLAFLSDIQVFMLLEAAQGDRRVNSMQAPRITVFNGQTASLSVNTFQTFLFGVTPTFLGDLLTFIPQSQPVPVNGIIQNITPVVTADRRFVRINIQHQMQNLASTNVPLVPIQVPVPQRFFSGITTNDPPVVFQMFFQQPSFETISVFTTVTVPDGGTVLLGGMKVMSEARNEFGPPILSKIPYLNRLFKNVGYGREGSSLMMMVTPRIIISEEEEQIFLGELPPLPRP